MFSLQIERKIYITRNVAQTVHSISSKTLDELSINYLVMTLIQKHSHNLVPANPAALFRIRLAMRLFLPRPPPLFPNFANVTFLLGLQLASLGAENIAPWCVGLTLRFP